MEKDLDIHNYKIINLAEPTLASDGARKTDVDAVQADLDGFQDGLKDLTQVEIQQLENIGANTISVTQWGYLGELNQPLKQTNSPTFSGLTVNGNITITGSVDGVDVSDKMPFQVSTTIIQTNSAVGTADSPEKINDGVASGSEYCSFDTDEYITIEFPRYIHIAKFGEIR